MTRSPRQRLVEVIERIEGARKAELILDEYEHEGKDIAVPLDAILYNMLVIGEAIKTIPEEIKERRPDVPWLSITGLRNILAHEYLDVNVEVIHLILDEPLDQLQSACEELLTFSGE
ncbi:MAG TPA: HepT-like ribonuclease domain-containing protein [Acidimicrobiales bacterium]